MPQVGDDLVSKPDVVLIRELSCLMGEQGRAAGKRRPRGEASSGKAF